MLRPRRVVIVAVSLATALWLVAGDRSATAQSLPAPGRYQCAGAGGIVAGLNFTVGPGNIYTTTTGLRDTMIIHPGSGNVLFRGATPQAAYEGRYSPGPPPQVALLTVIDAASNQTGIICQMR
jgi:hypothetical protein